MSLVRVNNLTRYYGSNCAVDHINFELAAGDILGFLGPNGAGKSTTMQMLSGNLAPSEGEIQINGIDLLDNPRQAKSVIGYLPETPPLYKEMTVDEYLGYCARLHGLERGAIKTAVALAKDRCGLTETGRRLIANLSKGFQQRVGIAQAILHSPEVIILDEPTVGLDPNQIREIRALIAELGKEHGIILCTHILPEVQAVCNRVQIINKGQLVYESNVEALLEKKLTGSYEVSLLRPPSLEDMHYLDCIEETEQLNEHTFLIHTGDSSIEYLVKVAVKNDWGLYKLLPHERTLEQIFVDLTMNDSGDENGDDNESDDDSSEQALVQEDTVEDVDAAYEKAVYGIFEEDANDNVDGEKHGKPES